MTADLNKSVLVVEDEPLLRMATVDSLETLGFRVEEASSAAEALSKMRLAGDRILAVIIDVGLPDRKGDSLAAELRTLNADLPMLFSTGYTEEVLRRRFPHDNKTGFLGKPYFAADLEAALRTLGINAPAPL
jgi:CheY-like chemotaxis protein